MTEWQYAKFYLGTHCDTVRAMRKGISLNDLGPQPELLLELVSELYRETGALLSRISQITGAIKTPTQRIGGK